MKQLQLLLLCLVVPMLAFADDAWNTTYKQIEQSIKAPEFAARDFNITKYGASPKASAVKNQKAINKAIDDLFK